MFKNMKLGTKLLVAFLACVTATIIGVIAGTAGGWIDSIIKLLLVVALTPACGEYLAG